jgi:hypothetical protein
VSTLLIVVLTILASIFCLLLLASIASLIYVYLSVRKQLAEFSTTVQSIGGKMEAQYNRVEILIGQINGQQIAKAAQEFLSQIPRQAQVATRIEKAVILFVDAIKSIGGDFEISGSAVQRAATSGLGPEDYAPAAPDEHFTSQSRTALGDREALAEEHEFNTQSFGNE